MYHESRAKFSESNAGILAQIRDKLARSRTLSISKHGRTLSRQPVTTSTRSTERAFQRSARIGGLSARYQTAPRTLHHCETRLKSTYPCISTRGSATNQFLKRYLLKTISRSNKNKDSKEWKGREPNFSARSSSRLIIFCS